MTSYPRRTRKRLELARDVESHGGVSRRVVLLRKVRGGAVPLPPDDAHHAPLVSLGKLAVRLQKLARLAVLAVAQNAEQRAGAEPSGGVEHADEVKRRETLRGKGL